MRLHLLWEIFQLQIGFTGGWWVTDWLTWACGPWILYSSVIGKVADGESDVRNPFLGWLNHVCVQPMLRARLGVYGVYSGKFITGGLLEVHLSPKQEPLVALGRLFLVSVSWDSPMESKCTCVCTRMHTHTHRLHLKCSFLKSYYDLQCQAR